MQLIQDWEFAELVHLENKGRKMLRVMKANSLRYHVATAHDSVPVLDLLPHLFSKWTPNAPVPLLDPALALAPVHAE